MSAWLVNDAHIDALMTFASTKRVSFYDETTKTRVEIRPGDEAIFGQILIDENYRSLNARYRDEHGEPHVYKHKMNSQDLHRPAVEILKACHCYDYQSCETEDYRESKAYAICQAIEQAAIRALPGYDDAPWGIEPNDSNEVVSLLSLCK